MIKRCTNPNTKAYNDYGGRGIKVADRWRHDFGAFLEDVGKRPSSSYSLDRYPNNDGNYEPGNTRWATKKQQAASRIRVENITANIVERWLNIRGWTLGTLGPQPQ
jgi:hypothetical protein